MTHTPVKTALPYSEGCYVCGNKNSLGLQIKFRKQEKQIITEFKATEQHQGYKGVVHGGILCTLLDETMSWAPTLMAKRMTMSAELNVRFIKPAPVAKKLIVCAEVKEVNRRLYKTFGQVSDDDGIVYATATGKFIPLSEKETAEVNSWLLYDEETLQVFNANDSVI